MPEIKIAILVGSLRKKSLTRKAARALAGLAPKRVACSFLEIGDLPLYNQDLDDQPPASWTRFRAEIDGHDAILFLTPEYNRSIPGCLKNAVDVGSRPEGENHFDGMPAGVVSVTPYQLGAFGANHALRQTFVFLNMPVMQQPEAYIADAGSLFDANDGLKSERTRAFFANYMSAFARWAEMIVSAAKREDFSQFMKQRENVAAAHVSGNAKPLDAIVPRTGEASFFPPNGGSVHGAEEVLSRYDQDAKSFAPGGSSSFDVLQSGADGDIGYWTGFQRADARLGDGYKKVQMKLRVTELFRFQEGGWKLIHRHADDSADRPH
ncbi:MAG TPA: NAD(P)H-dependent oxidoreductase [Steroidobacteraceae bacterium]|jgi:NAD(P)H-dependent FMN reductase/ketosteroid isomerase-like protein|nr:NAD(P)H-dependent oxidoreductase [Steroidobacteraceae bacterium]